MLSVVIFSLLLFFVSTTDADALRCPVGSVDLLNVPSLTFSVGEITRRARNNQPTDQLRCRDHVERRCPSSFHAFDEVVCRNIGIDPATNDPKWECTGESEKYIIREIGINCEGYRSRDDACTTDGSCALFYGVSPRPRSPPRTQTTTTTTTETTTEYHRPWTFDDFLFWLVIIVIILALFHSVS